MSMSYDIIHVKNSDLIDSCVIDSVNVCI